MYSFMDWFVKLLAFCWDILIKYARNKLLYLYQVIERMFEILSKCITGKSIKKGFKGLLKCVGYQNKLIEKVVFINN